MPLTASAPAGFVHAVDPSTLPTGALIAIGVLAVAQLALTVTALVVLARTPRERVVFGRKWVWALIIVFVNLVGAVVFFAVGRTPTKVTDPAPAAADASDDDTVARTIRSLYGDGDGPGPGESGGR
ncbi:MAG TPA: PLD nuclease N-terminal domain-containing protein [Candidatus Lumbricidophila sp.]|nr:PLD nuclease N-terminal domain-containing protein [Candidatus Lumbricidophila sp.]